MNDPQEREELLKRLAEVDQALEHTQALVTELRGDIQVLRVVKNALEKELSKHENY